MHRLHPANLRAAAWAFLAARRTRRRLREGGLEDALGPPPPPRGLPDAARRGAAAMLRRRGENCLVRAIVMQSWDAAHDRPRDLIIGVTGAANFRAHAWLEGDAVPVAGDEADFDAALIADVAAHPAFHGSAAGGGDGGQFQELLRRAAPSGARMP